MMKDAEKDDVSFEAFTNDISRIMKDVENGEEMKARVDFNTNVFPKYHGIVDDPENALYPLYFFFHELNDYFNNTGRHLLGKISKEYILETYYGDFQEDLQEFKKRER